MPVPTSPVRPVLITVRCARTWFSALLLVILSIGLAATVAWPITGRGVLGFLRTAPIEAGCASAMQRWAGMVRGTPVCDAPMVVGRRSTWMLQRIAQSGAYPQRSRMAALSALANAGTNSVGTRTALLLGPPSPPAFRRAALAALERTPAGGAADESARAAAPHGLTDDALLTLFSLGEPDTAAGTAETLAAFGNNLDPASRQKVLRGLGLSARDVHRGRFPGFPGRTDDALRAVCLDSCDARLSRLVRALARAEGTPDSPPAEHLSAGNDVIDMVADGEAANHLRIEFTQVGRWISEAGGINRVARLLNATAHTESDGAARTGAQRGDLHATLRAGGGTPGAAGFAAAVLGVLSGVPVNIWRTENGVVLEADNNFRAVSACAAPHALDRPPRGAIPLDFDSTTALFLLESSASALRAGDLPRAARLRDAAAERGTLDVTFAHIDLPALDADLLAAGASIVASAGATAGAPPGAPDNTPAAASTRLAPWVALPPRTRHRQAAAAPTPPPEPSGDANPVDKIRADAGGADELSLAAWWAAAYGRRDLARALAPQDGDSDLTTAALLLAGEPTAPTGPWSSRVAGGLTMASIPCHPPFRAWP